GSSLFNAIFRDPNIKELYLRNLSKIQEHPHLGLRFKFCINPEYPALANLMNLPWEYLHDPIEKRDFLNLFETLPIVRFLDLKRPIGPIRVENLPLRILVMISSPAGYPALDVSEEKRLLREAFSTHSEIEVDFLKKATLLELKDRLTDRDYHIFHYIGHGGFEKQTGKGVLVLEDEEGNGIFVAGEKLKRVFRGSSIGIVFLNACETARMSAEKDPFASIVSSLMIENILAVVAMQYPISDKSAIVFSKKFYTALAKGKPIDQAVTQGRLAIDLSSFDTLEWGIPVLFLRSEDGVVFDIKDEEKRPFRQQRQSIKTTTEETEDQTSHRGIPQEELLTMLFCKNCGEKLLPEGKYCRKCGTQVNL
ncbi:MAG: CHAT domain-containing protein, partial [Desulfuromonadaceae bacterium]